MGWDNNFAALPILRAQGYFRPSRRDVVDRNHSAPLLQLLLAQIYGAKRDSAGAASHLQQYLKLAPDSLDSGNLKKDLAEAQNPK